MNDTFTDYMLGNAVTLWRLRQPNRGEIACLVAQPRPGWCVLHVMRDDEVYVQRSVRASLAAALRWATETRDLVAAGGWRSYDPS